MYETDYRAEQHAHRLGLFSAVSCHHIFALPDQRTHSLLSTSGLRSQHPDFSIQTTWPLHQGAERLGREEEE